MRINRDFQSQRVDERTGRNSTEGSDTPLQGKEVLVCLLGKETSTDPHALTIPRIARHSSEDLGQIPPIL